MTNIQKPRLTASDITRIRNLAFEMNAKIEDFIHELGVEIAEREFDCHSDENWEKSEDFLFLDIMPVLTDMIFHNMKWEI